MVGVVRPPYNKATLKLLREWSTVVHEWELTGEWRDIQPVLHVAELLPGDVFIRTSNPPNSFQVTTAIARKVAGWRWTAPHVPHAPLHTGFIYRVVCDMSRRDPEYVGHVRRLNTQLQDLGDKYDVKLDPYWTDLDSDDEELPDMCDIDAVLLESVRAQRPFRCGCPRVVEVVPQGVRLCPFRARDLPVLRGATPTSLTTEELEQAFPCPHGCHYPHPVRAALRDHPVPTDLQRAPRTFHARRVLKRAHEAVESLRDTYRVLIGLRQHVSPARIADDLEELSKLLGDPNEP